MISEVSDGETAIHVRFQVRGLAHRRQSRQSHSSVGNRTSQVADLLLEAVRWRGQSQPQLPSSGTLSRQTGKLHILPVVIADDLLAAVQHIADLAG